MENSQIKSLINHQKSNYTLDQQFYIDDKITHWNVDKSIAA